MRASAFGCCQFLSSASVPVGFMLRQLRQEGGPSSWARERSGVSFLDRYKPLLWPEMGHMVIHGPILCPPITSSRTEGRVSSLRKGQGRVMLPEAQEQEWVLGGLRSCHCPLTGAE